MKTAEEYINELFKDDAEVLDKEKCYLIGKLMTDYAKYYHEQQVNSVDSADVVGQSEQVICVVPTCNNKQIEGAFHGLCSKHILLVSKS